MIKIINFVKEKIIQVCLKRKSLKYLDSKVIKKNCKKLSQNWAHEEVPQENSISSLETKRSITLVTT